ncbi:AmmeMemoRadiSam system protein B [Patescibacteria group bacterium]|nr:AmmeMemoRadiSam system protein B [Patescibacteria group bacterium]
MKIRKPVVAGQFYPAGPAELERVVTNHLSPVSDFRYQLKALVVPHAGYLYSGSVAGQAFGFLQGKHFQKIILMGPSHTTFFKGIALDEAAFYQTPLGEVSVSADVKNLLKEKGFSALPEAFIQEHALEVELPFLQKTLKDFEIIPLLCGSQNSLSEIKEFAQVLKKYINGQTLIVASVDFTHYGPAYGFVPFTDNIAENLKKLDEPVIEHLLHFATDKLYDYLQSKAVTNDGQIVLTLLSEILKGENCQAKVTARQSSGELTGDYTNSVSYVSMVFWQQSKDRSAQSNYYSAEEKEYLLELAQLTLKTYLQEHKVISIDSKKVPERLREKWGVFVTLTKDKKLRGCIGNILPGKPIYQAVMENVLNAAIDDPRFNPVTLEEIDDLVIEISILTLPKELKVRNHQEYLVKLKAEVDGVIIKQGNHTATYLPQVWEELKKPTEFLGSLCFKAGLSNDCWMDTNTQLLTYQAEVFKEKE